MTRCPGCRSSTPHAPGRLAEALEVADAYPDSAADLDDHVVAVLDAWSDGGNKIIRAEAERRRDEYLDLASRYTELADQFAASRTEPRWA